MAKDTAAGIAWLHGAVSVVMFFSNDTTEPPNHSSRFKASKFAGKY
jgi:hypothetical protein